VEVGVLALQGDFAEHCRALSELGAHPREVRRPEDLRDIRGLVLPGGESTTLGMLIDSSELREPIAKLLVAGTPAFGTCAGMILLACAVSDGRDDQETFGALDIAVRRNGYGRQLFSFEAELDVLGFDSPLPAVFIRAPVVERVGEGVEVLAEIEPGGSQLQSSPALVRQGAVLAAAFHPELTPDRRVHQMFLKMIEEKGP
jgi:5'-phosphate synthase pdxT subunit